MLPKNRAQMELEYDRFVNAYGTDSQMLKSIGEMSELTDVLAREQIARDQMQRGHDYYQSPDFEDLISEIADVYLMVDQLAFMFGREAVREKIAEKLKRALNQLGHFERSVGTE